MRKTGGPEPLLGVTLEGPRWYHYTILHSPPMEGFA